MRSVRARGRWRRRSRGRWFSRSRSATARASGRAVMPTPSAGENRTHFLSRCVPMLIHEGRKQSQAVAICHSLYRRKDDAETESDSPDTPP